MDLHALLGDDADGLLEPHVEGHRQGGPAPPRPGLPRPVPGADGPHRPRCCATSAASTTTAGWPAPATCRSCPVDQGIEHSAAASFAPNPIYFDPANICRLAVEGGCNAVASTFGVLGRGQPPVRPQDPLHREAQPQRAAHVPEPVRPDHVRLGEGGLRPRRGRGRRHDLLRLRASRPARSRRCRRPSRRPTTSGMFTVLWCYLRNSAFKTERADYHAVGRPHRPGQPPRA